MKIQRFDFFFDVSLTFLTLIFCVFSHRMLRAGFEFAKNTVFTGFFGSTVFYGVSRNYCAKMSKTALVVMAEGSEEMETIITVDVLRRAGISVTLAGLDGSTPILCSRQVTIVPDKALADVLKEKKDFDAVILPGGLGGSERFCKSSVIGDLLQEVEKSGRIVAAICAAPTAFAAHSIGVGKKVTSYPSTKATVMEGNKYTYIEGEKVVVDGNVVTSRGPGTAFAFALKLAEILVGAEKSGQVEKGMILTGY